MGYTYPLAPIREKKYVYDLAKELERKTIDLGQV